MFEVISVSGALHSKYYTQGHQHQIDFNMKGVAPAYGGALSAVLGLSGEFSRMAFLNAGIGLYRKPGTRAYADMNYHASRVKTKKSRDGQTAGYDALFVPPKSWAVAIAHGTPEQKALVLSILQQVNKNTMAYVESLACVRVTRDGGTEIVSAPGISYTTFSHEHTREGDAGIHFHNVISRAVRNPVTGELQGSGLDTQKIREGAMKIGAFSRSELVRLAREAGLAIVVEKTRIKGGRDDYVPELAGVPKALRDAHSGSRKRIEKTLMENRGKTLEEATLAEARMANRISRPMKVLRSEHELADMLAQALKTAKLKSDFELRLVGASEIYTHYNSATELVNAGIAHLDGRTAVFKSRHELAAVCMRQGNYLFSVEDIDAAIDASFASSALQYRYPENAEAGQYFRCKGERITNAATLTTARIIQQELETDQAYARGINTVVPLADWDAAKAAIEAMEAHLGSDKGPGELSQGQRDMIATIFTSSDRVVCVQGDAGTGKTTAGKVVADGANNTGEKALEESTRELVKVSGALRAVGAEKGYKVLGLAPSTMACGALNDAGIPTSTLQSTVKRGVASRAFWDQVDNNTVIVGDESSMWGTQDMNTILHEVEKRGARLVLIGDRFQLQSVERGAPFAQLVLAAEAAGKLVTMNKMTRAKTPEMHNQHRQARDDQRASIESLIASGHLLSSASEARRLEFVVDEMRKIAPEDRFKVPVIVDTNAARHLVTEHLRRALGCKTEVTLQGIERYDLSPVELTNYANYNIGDRIQFGRGVGDFKPQEQVVVTERCGNMLVVRRSNGHEALFEPTTQGASIQGVGYAETVELSVGEPIRFTGPVQLENGASIINGDRAKVDAIDLKRRKITVTVMDYDGKAKGTHELDLGTKDAPMPIRNGWAATVHSLQGASINRGLYYATGTSLEAWYVAMTRFRGMVDEPAWTVGVKVIADVDTERKREKLVAAATRSSAKERATPSSLADIELRKGRIAPSNAFWHPDAVGDMQRLQEVRVPRTLAESEEIILEKLLEFKTKYGDRMHVTGSPEFIARAAKVAVENDAGVAFTNRAGGQAMEALTNGYLVSC